MLFRSSVAFATVLFATSVFAQNRTPAGFIRIAPARTAHMHRPFLPAYGYYSVPYFYSDYADVEYVPPEPPPVPMPVMQVKTEPVPDPELLELHGNEWVRVTKFNTAGSSASTVQPISAKPLPPAVLVFRDGHREEVSSYSIIGDSIYTKANYWSTGKWTRTIQIANLDIPATIERNHERGINFELPTSPDEIMIRP
ncbi:MAG TPA: hypothetical protein VJ731_15670 [Terriglobales bacterium]|nr:hypothetical protein [Terriglobales bacterium]